MCRADETRVVRAECVYHRLWKAKATKIGKRQMMLFGALSHVFVADSSSILVCRLLPILVHKVVA